MMNINRENILRYAARYDRDATLRDKFVEGDTKNLLKRQRHLNKTDLIKIGLWKSKRPKRHYENNDDRAVKEITRFSFSAKSEQARIGALLALHGVSYPVASVILHFAFPNKYPILDFRVLWSLGEQPSSYTFEFWQKYCARIREISQELKLPIRTIDKALWQYSKEHQNNK